MPTPRITRSFYQRDPITVVKDLLGQTLVSTIDDQRVAGIIVETEAYLGTQDRAAHTYGGRQTDRVQSMWQDGGTAYVYFTYGMHHCFNIVTQHPGEPTAVLLRAIEPTEGIDTMRERRRKRQNQKLRDTDLCSGPAKLAQAFGLTKSAHDGLDLTTSDTLYLEHSRSAPLNHTHSGPRIGVAYAKDWADKPLRFWLPENPHVSR